MNKIKCYKYYQNTSWGSAEGVVFASTEKEGKEMIVSQSDLDDGLKKHKLNLTEIDMTIKEVHDFDCYM